MDLIRRSHRALPAALAGLVTTAGLVGLAPTSSAVAQCATKVARPDAAVDLVDKRSEVPAQKGGAKVTRAVRNAVADELAAERSGHLGEDEGSLWLDKCGQAFYVEPTDHEAQATQGTEVQAATQSADKQLFPLEDTFSLSSKPGSSRTIYLDFNGHTISGTAWNTSYWGSSALLPAYDFAGGASTFTDAERINIQNVWAFVAEDFAPFDVNVTTMDPGADAITRDSSADQLYGSRAVVTNDTTGQSRCGCGGIAYVGVFNSTSSHAYYQPALVFTQGVGYGAKNVAEALSHEVGHNLGLVHQGVTGGPGYYTGHGSWAPIMGVGYYKPISQWARGEYAGANSGQDELSVMNSLGLSYRTDDHGNDAASATVLSGPLTAGATSPGVISTPADVDTFRVDLPSAGDVTITASPTAVGANLDMRLTLRDAAGNVVASEDELSTHTAHDHAQGLGAEVLLTGIAAGTYYASVEGVGARSAATDGYTDYGSLGQYVLDVTTAASDAPVVTSAAPGELTTGIAYRHAFTATATGGGALTWRLTGALPTGVTFDAATGTLSGRTTVQGAFPVTMTVTDASARATSRRYTIRSAGTVLPGALSASTGVVGRSYSGQLAAAGGTAPYRWTAVSKPSWATVSASGAVTGVPTAAGPDVFALTVTDAAGRTATRQYTVNVSGPLVVRDLAGRLGSSVGGTVLAGTRFSFPVPVYGGTRAYAVTGDVVPAGVTVSGSGTVSGSLSTPGDRTLTVSVRDAVGARVTKTLTLRVVDPLVLSGTVPAASVGQPLSATFTPVGGVAPYTVTAAGVPTGLAFDAATGVLSGTPTAVATAAVTLTVTDAVGRVYTRRVSMRIRTALTTTVGQLPGASTGRSYSARLTATGGTGTYSWRVSAGGLPPGLTLSTSGSISGTPTTAGTYVVSFTARDAEGRTDEASTVEIVVAAPVVQGTTAVPAGAVGQAYSHALSTTGGTGAYTYTSTSPFPAGLSLSPDGVISGTPTAVATASISVKVTDSGGRVATRSFTLRVL